MIEVININIRSCYQNISTGSLSRVKATLILQNIVQTPDKHQERSSMMMMMVVTLIAVVFLQELIAGEEEDEGVTITFVQY